MKIPRASFGVSILDDEDYCALTSRPGGWEAFGVFVAMVITARERAARSTSTKSVIKKILKKPRSNSAVFNESYHHVARRAGVSVEKLHSCLHLLKTVADEVGTEPWMYLDSSEHLVIRSFFTYNQLEGWGGPREGSGRKIKINQDDTENNQDEKLENCQGFSSGGASSSVSSSSSSSINTPLPPEGEVVRPKRRKKELGPLPDPPDWLDRPTWDDWLEHRRSIRKPMTPLGATKAFAQLGDARKAGRDPASIINRSIANGYQGLFDSGGGNGAAHANQATRLEQDEVITAPRREKGKPQ